MISIVMPVFNSSSYLREALESIMNQTYTDYELISIDDGSSDNSMQILQEFATRDKRISIYRNENRVGAAECRNKGIKYSKGEYIIFLDSDDLFHHQMLEKLYCKASEHNADIVCQDFMNVASAEINEPIYREHGEYFVKRYCSKSFSVSELDSYEVLSFPLCTWNRLYNAKFIRDEKILFQSLPSSNDVAFSIISLFKAKRIVWLNSRDVMLHIRNHYDQHRISNYRDPLCAFNATLFAKERLEQDGMFERYKNAIVYICYYCAIFALNRCENSISKQTFSFYSNEMRKILFSNVDELPYEIEQRIKKIELGDLFYEEIVKDNILDIYLENNIQRISKEIENSRNNGKCVLWGFGNNGKVFLNFCKRHNIDIDYVVDKNCCKEQLQCEILKPNDIDDKIGAVVFSPYSELKPNLEECPWIKNDTLIIDLVRYIGFL